MYSLGIVFLIGILQITSATKRVPVSQLISGPKILGHAGSPVGKWRMAESVGSRRGGPARRFRWRDQIELQGWNAAQDALSLNG